MCDEHREFKDMKLFYRFRKDDGTFPLDSEAKVFVRGQRIYEKYDHAQMHQAEPQHTAQACLPLCCISSRAENRGRNPSLLCLSISSRIQSLFYMLNDVSVAGIWDSDRIP